MYHPSLPVYCVTLSRPYKSQASGSPTSALVLTLKWAEEAFPSHGAGLDGSGGSLQGASGSVDDMQGQMAVAVLPIPDMSREL